MSYPIYHQNWDGSSSTYSDWNLASLGGTANSVFTVGTPSVTSASNALQIAPDPTIWHGLCKLTAESSADGTATAYLKMSDGALAGLITRVQGLSLVAGDFNCYGMFIYADSSGPAYQFELFKYTPDAAEVANIVASSLPLTSVYMYEIRLLGSAIKCRLLDKTLNQWLKSDGTWSATPVDAISVTDTSISAAGRIGVTSYGANARQVDDIFWDPPVPTIDHGTLSVALGTTSPLTAGGFSDPLAGVTWSSSNTGVATVSSTGVVTPVAHGTATIWATGIADRSQVAECSLTVPVSSGDPVLTSFAKAIDNVSTTVTTARSTSGGTLVVADASKIALASGQWVRVSIVRSGSVVTVLKATAVSGNTLTISGPADGVSDAACNVGDVAELRVDAGAFMDIHTAINNLESGGSSSFSGNYDGTITTNGATLPTDAAAGSIVAYAPGGGSFVHAQVQDVSGTYGGFTVGYGPGGVPKWLMGLSKNLSDQTALAFFEDVDGGKARLVISTGGKVLFQKEFAPAHLANSAASNDSIYFSTDAGKLVYKDSSGVANSLY